MTRRGLMTDSIDKLVYVANEKCRSYLNYIDVFFSDCIAVVIDTMII